MPEMDYPKVILSPIPIDELIIRLADELERRAALKSQSPPEVVISEAKRLYGDKAAAEHIGCSTGQVGKLRKTGKIRYRNLGKRYYYYAHEIDEDLLGGKHRFGELRGRRRKI